ncbi:hypothetical protein SAMN05428988_0115, partial [Chitinophaga sp. YR573]|uniref:hypothetical protein n=1 Tax=Chitinophaga sp. YR573 TaxID=1881040 RepID=UPI0008C2C0B1
TDKRNEAGEQLLKQSPSNEDLRYIIEYTDKRNEAWEQLLKQSPSNEDLRYIIEYTDKRNEAGEQLLKQSPSNEDLTVLITNGVMIHEASAVLRERFGAQMVDEAALIKDIATTVNNQPGCLQMEKWHCGTSHCIAGWATILSPIAREIEQKTDTKTAGCTVIPSLAYLFFSDNDTVLKKLKEIASI